MKFQLLLFLNHLFYWSCIGNVCCLQVSDSVAQSTLMQAYAIERRLEMIQLYLGTDPITCLCFYYLKKVQDGEGICWPIRYWRFTMNCPCCVHITPHWSLSSVYLWLCVSYLFFLYKCSSHHIGLIFIFYK